MVKQKTVLTFATLLIPILLLAALIPVQLWADATPGDWIGEYRMNHDGHTGALRIVGKKQRCPVERPWCFLSASYTDSNGTVFETRIESVDDSGQHMAFVVSFPGNPQRFDVYLFSWDKSKMAGTTVWLGRTFGMFAEKTSMGALIGAKVASPSGAAAAGSAATTKTVRPDGTIELRYPDGTVKTKKLKQCGWDTTYPDGRFQPAECVRMEAIPAQVPSLPSDPVQSNWLDWESRALLSIIQGIFGGQTAGFANYQSNYESGNMDVYNLIMIRTVAVDQLSHTP
jgi:hypothetical protein